MALHLEQRMLLDALTVWFHHRAPDLARVISTSTPHTVLTTSRDTPDVVITDHRAPSVPTMFPGAALIIITDQAPSLGDELNPVGYVSLADPPETLLDAVVTVGQGRPFVSAGIDALRSAKTAVRLTATQHHVVSLYIDDLSAAKVAEQCGIAVETVASHLRNARKKFRAAGIPVATKIQLRTALAAGSPPVPARNPSCRWPTAASLATIATTTDWDQFSTVLSTLQIAALLRITPDDVRSRFVDGTIPAHRMGKYWIVFTAEFRTWIITTTTPDDSEPAEPVEPVDVLAGYGDTMTYKDLMVVFDKSKLTVYRWIDDGLIPAYRIGKRWLIRTRYLRDALSENSNQPPP